MSSETTFTDLYADILLQIFQYFTVNELYFSFGQAIPQLTSLLIKSNVRLHLRESIITPVDPGQVISLHVALLPRSSSSSLSDFVNLRSLKIHDLEDPSLLIHRPLSQQLERLHLNISLRYRHTIFVDLFPIVIQLPKLKYCTMIYPSSHFVLRDEMISLSTLSMTLVNLHLEVKCSILAIEKLLTYLPCLHCLHTMLESDLANANRPLQMSFFPSVQYLFLSWQYIPIRDVVRLCQTMPNLQQCQLKASDYRDDTDIFYPQTWQAFIERDHTVLKHLQVEMHCAPPCHERRNLFQLIQNAYFHAINFKFTKDMWGNIVLEGNYSQ